MKLTKNAQQVLDARYLIKDATGKKTETADALFKRVAKHIASAEKGDKLKWENRFYDIMAKLEFLPNSPTLMNAGLSNGQLSACFVLPIEDSLESIFNTLKNAALIHQSGGGTGYNFSNLRPKGDKVTSSGGTSSGPVAFIKIYDTATEHVKQGGKRRGANMGILNADHPDIAEFVAAKSVQNQLQNFNLSVGITDDFMKATIAKKDWKLINPRTKKVAKTIKAAGLWELIVEQAWRTGDPGLIFLDSMNSHNPIPLQGRIQSTNPCGEVPLLDYESCNLGSINLTKMLKIGSEGVIIDWAKLRKTIEASIRFLDNVITVNHYLLPEIEAKTQKNRKVGLGVMGWAELLMELEIPYTSAEAIMLAEKLMAFVQSTSYETSAQLAKERGEFQNWNKSVYYPNRPMRNATCNSIAPTGSISVIANTSYSIEPLFALAFKRVGILNNKTQTEINPIFLKKMKLLGLWNEELEQEVLSNGRIGHIKTIPLEVRKLFQTSLEIPWKVHLEHQRAFQKFTDNAVSKTINLSKGTSKKEISEIYKTAWEYGLKGITIYRDGSRTNQVIQTCNFNNSENC